MRRTLGVALLLGALAGVYGGGASAAPVSSPAAFGPPTRRPPGVPALPPGWTRSLGSRPALSWKSPVRVPTGDAVVEFWAGDRLLGRPSMARDGRTFRLPTPHAGALNGLQVLASGRRLDAATATPRRAPVPPRPMPVAPANSVDPGRAGPYRIVTGEYSLAAEKLRG